MKRLRMGLCLALMLCGTLFAAQQSEAISIVYEAADLADVVAGEDLWQYTYTIADFTFDQYEGFTIYFDADWYGDIEDSPSAPNSHWNVLTWDPDAILPDDGAYDAQALVDGASLADTFTVSFVWLGGGAPGTQLYELYYDDGINFDSLSAGTTVSPVPEPSTWALLTVGLASLIGCRRRNNRHG